jgi:signal transduction histidine kinase
MPGRLDLTIRKAVELVQPQMKKKGITIDCQDLPPVEVEMDAVLIQRLLCNLFVNAGDASPVGAGIQARIQSLAKTEVGRNWYRVQIIDRGEGISREHMRLIFRPYFTTKDRGGEQRGFGLGLAIFVRLSTCTGEI